MNFKNQATLNLLTIFIALGILSLHLSSITGNNQQDETRVERIPQLSKGKIVTTIEIPDAIIQGVVRIKEHLWVVNSRKKALLKINIGKKKVVHSLPIPIGSPKGLTWDGKYFWCLDNKTTRVQQIDPSNGEIIKSLDVPIPGKKGSVILEALAADGEFLWIAYAAGWSSQILKMEIDTGKVVLAVFANCHPRALAVDGKYLWVISYNKGKYPGVISRRIITDDPDKMNLSRKFLCKTQGKEPTGIIADGKYLWVADKKMLQKISVPRGRK